MNWTTTLLMLGSSPDLPRRVQYPAPKSLPWWDPPGYCTPELWGNALGTVPELRHVETRVLHPAKEATGIACFNGK